MNSRSTVGTSTDATAQCRILLSERVDALHETLASLSAIGLGSLSLDRAAGITDVDRVKLKPTVGAATGAIEVCDATRDNVGDVSADLPLEMRTALTGVTGSGKSSLSAELPQRVLGLRGAVKRSQVPAGGCELHRDIV